MAIGVSGTTVTIGAPANIITASCVVGSTTTYALTATTALVLYCSGASNYALNAVVISVSGSTCTVGSPASCPSTCSAGGPAISTLLSATKGLVVVDNNTTTAFAHALTISGTTVTWGAALTVEAGITGWATSNYTVYSGFSVTRYNPHLFPLSANTALLWYFDSNSVSRAVVLTESAGVVTAGAILYRSISWAASGGTGAGAIFPQGATEFCSIKMFYGVSEGYGSYVTTNKISGASITVGASRSIGAPCGAPYYQNCTRLSTGKYVLHGSRGSADGASELQVFNSNGDYVSLLGDISVPAMEGVLYAAGLITPIAVSSNRIALMGKVMTGTTVAVTTYQLRLLNIEIAA